MADSTKPVDAQQHPKVKDRDKQNPTARPKKKEFQSKVQEEGRGGMKEQTSAGEGEVKKGEEVSSRTRETKAPVTDPLATDRAKGALPHLSQSNCRVTLKHACHI